MATKKTARTKQPAAPASSRGATRKRRSDDDKIRLVRQVMQSGNQSAEIKKLGIYPNQFYDWKKKFAAQLGDVEASTARGKRGGAIGSAARTVADEAKAYIQGKAALLQRLRTQRGELDELIAQLEN